MFKNRSKILFVATLLATVYVVYLICYFGGMIGSSDSVESLGGAMATALILPHIFMIALGLIFAWIGFFAPNTWGALVGAILYCVGAVLFILYAMFCIPLIILGFIGYVNQKKLLKNE